MNKTSFNGNMVTGNPLKIMLLFSIPILIGNIFQQLYNVVDTAVIGNVLGDTSLAAIGATSCVYSLIIGFSSGVTNGFSVVLARFYGADDEKGIKKTAALTFVLTSIISVILIIVSMFGIRPLLEFLKTPNNIINDSESFLRIILIFSFVTMFYNMFAGMLRAIGNSRMPLYFLVVSIIINIILDILFVKYLSFGIKGAAYATVISQAVSVILCIIYIYKECPLLRFDKNYLKPNRYLITELSTTGLSMGLMLAVVSVGSVALQSAVNSFGSEIIAAHTAARKIDEIFMLPLGTLSMASATFASQNLGAGKMHRVKKGVFISIGIAFIWSAFANLVVFIGCDFMVKALTGSDKQIILQTAAKYMYINIPFFFVLSILLVLRSSLQGIGRKIVPLSASFIELIAKFLAVGFLAPSLGYLGVCILEPAIWIICAIIVVIDFTLFIKRSTKDNI